MVCFRAVWGENVFHSTKSFLLAKLSRFSPVPLSLSTYGSINNPDVKQSWRSSRYGKFILPPLLFFLVTVSSCEASPLNPQPVALSGPFFQGWLVRTIDHSCRRSFILIVGSFSKRGTKTFDEHYVFCGVETPDGVQQFEAFPHPSTVSIQGSSPSLPFPTSYSPFAQKTNITWEADKVGWFRFNDEECSANFKLGGARIAFSSKNRLPWSKDNLHSGGPEGRLGYIPHLLPCHYFVHSVGSSCEYKLELPSREKKSDNALRALLSATNTLCGEGYTHIEGNHGTAFPKGWVWSQAISRDNEASFSLTGGRFEIGFLSPLNFILFLRIKGKVRIFRTTDLDSVEYDLDGITGTIKISAQSVFGQSRVELSIRPQTTFERSFGRPIYIPTPQGFTDKPGCRETYTAMADVICSEFDRESGTYKQSDTIAFPLTALEFGGSFQGIRQLSKEKRREVLLSMGVSPRYI